MVVSALEDYCKVLIKFILQYMKETTPCMMTQMCSLTQTQDIPFIFSSVLTEQPLYLFLSEDTELSHPFTFLYFYAVLALELERRNKITLWVSEMAHKGLYNTKK